MNYRELLTLQGLEILPHPEMPMDQIHLEKERAVINPNMLDTPVLDEDRALFERELAVHRSRPPDSHVANPLQHLGRLMDEMRKGNA